MMAGRVEKAFALTPLQEAMLYRTLRNPGSGIYHGQCEALLTGPFDEEAFRAAWTRSAERHEVFRTVFAWERRERPLQVVLDSVPLELRFLDWTFLDPEVRRERWAAVLEKDRHQPFDLAQAPLMRIVVVREAPGIHRLLWSVHHALLDGWSAFAVLGEVLEDHDVLARGGSVVRPPAPSFAQFVGWVEAQDSGAAGAYWASLLRGIDRATPPPFDSPGLPGSERVLTELALTPDETARAGAAASQHRVTLNTLIVAAWARVLGRRTARSDVLFGVTVSERPAAIPGIGTAAGLYINTIPARVRLPGRARLGAWLADLQKDLSEGRAHGSLGLAEIQRASDVREGPLLNSLVVFESFPDSVRRPGDRRVLEPAEISVRSPSDLPVALLAHPGERLRLELEHDTEMLKREDAEVLLEEVVGELRILAGDPDRLLSELDSVGLRPALRLQSRPASHSESPTESIVTGPRLERPAEDVLALIASRVRRDPHVTALSGPFGRVSYGEMDRWADEVALRIISAGGRPESMVGVLAGRSAEAIVGSLGVLKAGCAYLPLDPGHPSARLERMAASADLVIAAKEHEAILPPGRNRVLFPERGFASTEEAPLAGTDTVPSDQAAYAIFTSGSTGEPKAVVVERRQLAWSTAARLQYYERHPGCFLLLSPMTVDSAIAGIYWTLCSGGTLVLPAARAEQDVEGLARLISTESVTHTLLVPSLYQALLESADPAMLESLEVVVVAGEACHASVVRTHQGTLPGVALFNEYGPSEASVWATVDELTAHPGGPVTIGIPVPSVRIYLLDDELQEVEEGATGEICIAGPGVARGYLNQPKQTSERFIHDPRHPDSRIYRTGDLGRRLGDGRLQFLGRLDDQIKVRGHRVEVGEIESALTAHPAVRDAVVGLAVPGLAAPGLAFGSTPSPDELAAALMALGAHEADAILREVEGMVEARND